MFKKNQPHHLFINKPACKMFLTIFMVFVNFHINAQSDNYFDGNFKIAARVGVNSTSFKLAENLSTDDYLSNSKMGFYSGAYFSAPLSEYFQPFVELGFESINSNIDYKKSNLTNTYSEAFKGDVSLNYISFGLCPNIVIPIQHINLNFYGGFHFSLLTSAKENGTYEKVFVDTVSTQITLVKTDVNGKNKLLTEGFDSGFITGFGFEYKIDDRMAIKADSRFRFGTTLVSNAYKTRTWGVVLGFVYAL